MRSGANYSLTRFLMLFILLIKWCYFSIENQFIRRIVRDHICFILSRFHRALIKLPRIMKCLVSQSVEVYFVDGSGGGGGWDRQSDFGLGLSEGDGVSFCERCSCFDVPTFPQFITIFPASVAAATTAVALRRLRFRYLLYDAGSAARPSRYIPQLARRLHITWEMMWDSSRRRRQRWERFTFATIPSNKETKNARTRAEIHFEPAAQWTDIENS